MATFGIDLGTTYSCIAHVDESGRATVIKNSLGEETTPSVVYFESADSVVVGKDAKNVARLYPDLVVSLIKREMGKGWGRTLHGKKHTPETVSALILRELAKSASEQVGEPVEDVVITVPAYFGVAEREATRNAGSIAGLNVLNVVPEPVAAALHYEALGSGTDRTILVFDLGGGTFDTTVIKLVGDDIHVVCTDGDHHLGGADWDVKIADFLLERFLAENPGSEAGDSEENMQELLIVSEELKKSLSSTTSRRHTMRFDGGTCRAEITRAQFEALASELLDRTMDITARTLETAGDKGVHSFDDVLLVGGSTRIPAVTARLRERFGFEPRLHDPDQAVAKGAALFALIESVKIMLPVDSEGAPRTDVSETEVKNVAYKLGLTEEKVRRLAGKSVTTVVPRAFGIKVILNPEDEEPDFKITHILEANRPLPASPDTKQFYTAYPDQQSIEVEVWEQAGSVASSDLADNNKIGQGTITGLPPLPKDSPIDVTFKMNEMGLLKVEAVELKTGKKLNMELQIKGWSEEDVNTAKDAIALYAISE
jgi:molecular chaperone DnaK